MQATHIEPLEWQERHLSSKAQPFTEIHMPRGSGKTTLCAFYAARANSSVLYISPKFYGHEHFLHALASVCPEADINRSGATLPNGARIHCISFRSRTRIRGLRAELALVDDAEFAERGVFDDLALIPRVIALESDV